MKLKQIIINSIAAIVLSGNIAVQAEDYNLVYFDGHIHTVNSDGSGYIADVKTAAQARGLDAVIVTNHTRQIDGTNNLTHEDTWGGLGNGQTEWEAIVAECKSLSDENFIMIPSFEVTGSEGMFLRDHFLAWGVMDPFVGENSLEMSPEETWGSPANPAGTGPLYPEHIQQWIKYIHQNGGMAVHAHTSGSTQPSYGNDFIEIWNVGHVKDNASYAAGLGLSTVEAVGMGVMLNDMAIDGDKHLFDTFDIPTLGGEISMRNALYAATYYYTGVGQWLGEDPSGQTPNGTPIYSWDELLMMYVNGELDHPIYGVANSDAHNTGKVNSEDTDTNYDFEAIDTYSNVGEGKNGVYLDGELNANSLLKSMKQGHSFATNGPSVYFSIDDKIMGDTVMVSGSCDSVNEIALHLNVNAERSNAILYNVKVIKNGEVIFEAAPCYPTYEADIIETVTENCYYRVEVTALDNVMAQSGEYPFFYAWGNPIFVELDSIYPAGDTDKDCKVNLIDLANVAKDWLFGEAMIVE